MYKSICIVLIVGVCSCLAEPKAKPGLVAAAYTAPAVVTAQSSQVFARNYNGLVSPVAAASPLVAAPIVKTAPLIAAPPAQISYSPYYNPYLAPYVASSPYLY